ncbi:GntR family transcriptional regulator [Novosphingobium sp.]|uniref:GntR family transcriptional regulator n=1 Tax=Novosphingobium sp. TaxID=1874826 RepID=UPI00260125B1|nr:GntR family transcriptional regulator [Novosphingobium sp.]MCC6925263.1 GntR family transcriptional regulator [Novosphingobium sp.]
MTVLDLTGPLDAASPLPLYRQLEIALRRSIEARQVLPGDALPPERDVAVQLGVSRITVRKALDALVSDGFLARRQGAGTFVTKRVEKNFSKLTSFTEDMLARGLKPHSTWLSRTEATVSPEEAITLGLSPGARVYRFNRARFADGEPMALEYATVPGMFLESAEAVEGSLYEALARNGNQPTRVLQRLRAIQFNAEQSEILGVEPGAAGLLIERRGFAANGQLVESTRSFYRGDTYDFVAELKAE